MSDPTRIRVLCVDDHPLLREGIAAIINSQPDMVLIADASNGTEAIQKFKEHRPDVTLMDLRLPDISGVDSLMAIRADAPDARIIMLSTFEGDVEIQRALQAGARAYLLKNMPPKELVEVIRQVHAGKKRIPTEIAAAVTGIATSQNDSSSPKRLSRFTSNTSWRNLALAIVLRQLQSRCGEESSSCRRTKIVHLFDLRSSYCSGGL